MTDRRFKDKILQKKSPECKSIKLMMYRDPNSNLAKIQMTILICV